MPNFRPKRVTDIRVAESRLRQLAALRDLFENAFVDQIKELRHHGKRRDLTL